MDRVWIGEALRHIRVLAGVSREEAAAACKVSPGTVSHWENGRVLPKLDQLRTLAGLYRKMPLETMLYETGYTRELVTVSLREWYAQVQAEAESAERSRKSAQPFGEKLRRHDVSKPPKRPQQDLSTNFKTPAAAALRGHGSKVSAPLRT